MAETFTKEDIASRLDQKTNEINAHLESLKTGAEEVKRDVLEEVRRRPFIFIAGGLAIGLLIGLLLRRRRKPETVAEAYTELVKKYMDGVVDEAGKLMKKGVSKDEAISRVVRDRGPVFVYAPASARREKADKSSFFREMIFAAALPVLQAAAQQFIGKMEADGGRKERNQEPAAGASAAGSVPPTSAGIP